MVFGDRSARLAGTPAVPVELAGPKGRRARSLLRRPLGESLIIRPGMRSRARLPRRIRAGLFAGVAGLLSFTAARLAPAATERLYAHGLYPALVGPLSRITSRVPFSLAEPVFVAIPLALIASAAVGYNRRRRGGTRAAALGEGALRLLGEAGWIWCAFLILWGFNYARPDPRELFGLGGTVGADRAPALIERVGAALDAARIASPEDGSGVVAFGRFEDVDRRVRDLQLEALAEQGWPAIGAPRAKRFLASPLLLRWGVSGVYGPFTAEVNVVDPAPPGQLPFVIAHERAHLAGFAWEEAASFVALLTLWRAPEPELRYAGWLAVWLELGRGPKGRTPGVRRDMRAMLDFFKKHRGREAPVVRRVYSAYLEAHGVRGGTRSYRRVADLALRYLDRHPWPFRAPGRSEPRGSAPSPAPGGP
ncbi:MAG: DUF3810 family protein [Acidobacteria bacterium]|nr:MAG: DUF3810 family protein [Acidobacteriota bacterium]